MKKQLALIALAIGISLVSAQTPTLTVPSGGTGIGTIPNQYILAGSSTLRTQAVSTTTLYNWLNIQTGITNAYASSTFPSFTYASNTYYFASNPNGYITSSALTPYVTYTYASTTFASTSWVVATFYPSSNPSGYITNSVSNLTNYPTYTYASTTFASTSWVSSTFYLASNPSGYITNAVSNLTNYPTYTYASTTFASTSWVTSVFAPLASPIFTGTTTHTNIKISGFFRDSINATGTSGQVLISTGTSTLWQTLSGGGITSLAGLTAASQTFATSSDTNLGLTIVSSGSSHTFTPTWIGTLADGRIASSAAWNAAAASTTALTPAYIRGLFSSTATGLTYTNTTGAFSLTGGYVIPLSASTTEWAAASASTTALTPAYIRGLFSATYPINLSNGVISTGFSTSTVNSYSAQQTFVTASSTTAFTTPTLYFTNASSTGGLTTGSVYANIYPTGLSNAFLSVDPQGKIIATTSPGGTTYTGTYPIIVSGSVISTGFATTTNNTFTGTTSLATTTFRSAVIDTTGSLGSSGQVLSSTGTSTKWITSAGGGEVTYSYGSTTYQGRYQEVYNQSYASQGAGFSTDTYVVGSTTTIPVQGLQKGSRYYLRLYASKTAAGTAVSTTTVRFGTNGSTADTARCTMLGRPQTAAADFAVFEVWVTFNSVGSGSSAVMACSMRITHQLSITGFGNLVSMATTTTSAGFDSTVANSIIGVSLNGGTSASWTISTVQAKLENLP